MQNKKMLWIIVGFATAFLIVFIVFGVLILGKLDKSESAAVTATTENTLDASTSDADAAKSDDADDESDKADADDAADDSDADSDEDLADADDSEDEAAKDTEEADDADEESDEIRAYLAERFPKLTEGYAAPKSDNTFWINIDEDTRAKLDALDSDYNKIAWAVEYAFRQMPNVVASFTINENGGVPYVFLAFTNVGDKPISVDGTADIYNFDNERLTSGYPYTGLLQPGGTYICPIACPGVDEGDIDLGYTELNLDFPAAKEGSYSYEAKLGDSTNSSIVTSISVKNTGDKKVAMGQVTVLLLDEKGLPVANGYVFAATSTEPGATMDSDVTINILGSDVDKIEDIAVFASPYIVG